MTKEFILSDKIVFTPNHRAVVVTDDLKEFIRLLKEEAQWNLSGIIGQSITAELHDLIDKLAGDKLK